MKFLLTEIYYDNGNVAAEYVSYEGEDFTEHESLNTCDVYRRIVGTEQEAKQGVLDALNA